MRILAIVVAGVLAVVGAAAADPRGDLQAKGEQQAKDGRYGDAIDSFKAADRLQPRASHACLIALAYTRLERWPQAELHLAMCHERARAGDPLPDWVPLADQQIKERLQAANVVEVSIEVRPPTARARVTVSSFAPDEVFDPRTIHLSPGTHVIFAKAEGFPDRQHTLEIKDKTPQRVVIEMVPSAAGIGTATSLPDEQPIERKPSRLGMYLMIGGAVVGVVGISGHINMGRLHKKLDAASRANNLAVYREHETPYERARSFTIGCYVISAGLLVTGYFLRRSAKQEAATVSAVPLPEGGAFVSLGWTR